MNEDVRWKQRLENYKKALSHLSFAINIASQRQLNEIEEQGFIKAFEFTFELAWNVMKDYLTDMGITEIVGSKGAIRHAFNQGLITEGQTWLTMVTDRNRSSHTYENEIKNELLQKIKNQYTRNCCCLQKIWRVYNNVRFAGLHIANINKLA
jgi:nucleotidyltransferase substrate binding protein (TIGR01987 family)